MRRAIGFFVVSVALAVMWPSLAAAQGLSACKVYSATPSPQQAPLAEGADPKAPRPYIAKGDPNGLDKYVTLICDKAQLLADEVEFYPEQNLLKARGHVTFIEGTQRINADHIEFNTKTKLGTFWDAQGIMMIAGKADPKSMLGATEADAYFFGEKIEKIGPDRYRFTNGTFTTCVQPTPRWDLVAAHVVMVKDRHAVMSNVVLHVKNVPILYLPWFYYPINKENRATGFLMPTYGNSTVRGHMLSTAFFWAINRSQDATLHYNYSSIAGNGYGAEYRYVQAPGSTGSITSTLFQGKPNDTTTLFTTKTYQINGSMVQQLPMRLELRGNVDYYNDVRTQQLQQNVNASTNSQRGAEFNLRGGSGRILADAEAGFREIFSSTTQGSRIGNLPRIGVTLSQAPIGRSRVYFGATSEFSALIRQDDINDPKTSRNVARFDVNPIVRAPIGNLPYLNINASAGFRSTMWSQQVTATGEQIPTLLSRQLFDLGVSLKGPIFSRIFDTPGSRYATRWKHVIEPSYSIQRTSLFKDFAKVPRNDNIDTLVGGSTSMTYGLANRFLAKRKTGEGPAAAQEVASITLQQTYYSNAAAAFYDTNYQSSSTVTKPTNFSPLSLNATVQPGGGANASLRMEYDTQFHGLRSTSLGGGVAAPRFDAGADWSKSTYLSADPLSGQTIKTKGSQALNTRATLRTLDHHFTGTWSWSYDFLRKQQLQQRLTTAYMSQCCGIAVEYQVYNLGGLGVSGLQQDKRFNISFSLGGIGTFTNLLGAFGR